MGNTTEQDGRDKRELTPEERRANLEARLAEIDAKIPSPEQRALMVMQKLPTGEIKAWDLFCFCVETMGHLVSVFPDFTQQVKDLHVSVYASHYANWQTIKKLDDGI